MATNPPIYITKPHLPPRGEFDKYLDQIWQSHRITNEGPFHEELEHKLAALIPAREPADAYDTAFVSLVTNGTLAIVLALDALRVTGEVITTPFTFAATANALYWRALKPVFVDIDPISFCIDPAKIQQAITPNTTAILGVHVFGRPCDVIAIEYIAKTHNLKVIYDAAHAFGINYMDESLLRWGDISTLSFHATKSFHTIEGGAVITHDQDMAKRIDRLRNFGFMYPVGEEIMEPGLNAKMDEFRAAMGLAMLECLPGLIEQRARVANRYRANLAHIPVVRLPATISQATENHTYFPVLVHANSRDIVHTKLIADFNIFTRRYFYPLVSAFPAYRTLPSASAANLPCATDLAKEILCLPIYPDLSDGDVDYICESLESTLP